MAATAANLVLARLRHYLALKNISVLSRRARVDNVLEAATSPIPGTLGAI